MGSSGSVDPRDAEIRNSRGREKFRSEQEVTQLQQNLGCLGPS